MNRIILILLFLFPFSAFCQIEKYKIYNISTDEGLPSDNINFVYQDSYGFLWMASFEGLIRWDGSGYKKYSYSENDKNSISNNIVYGILEDHKKRLWIATIDGLDLYDREKDKFIKCKINDEHEKVPVNAIIEDSKKQLWLGTSYGLCKYDYEKKSYEWFLNEQGNDNSISDGVIFGLAKDKEDNLWIGTFNGGLNKYSQSSKKFTRFYHKQGDPSTICSNKIKSVMVDHDNNVWIGSYDKGISQLNPEGKVIAHYQLVSNNDRKESDRNIVSFIYEDKGHTIWVGAEKEQLHYLDKERKRFLPLEQTPYKKSSINCSSVSSIYEDTFGNLWFASTAYGMFYTNSNKNAFRHYFKENNISKELKNNIISAFCEASNGIIWIGTDGGGITSFNPKTNDFKSYTTEDGLNSGTIYDIKEDKEGKLWLASWSGGLIRFDPSTGKSESFVNNPSDQNSLIYNNIKSILIEDSVIWIGTHGEGLCIYNFKRKSFTHHSNNKTYPFDLKSPAWINHLFRDSKNRIWISTYSGLFLYDRKQLKHFTHTIENGSISSNAVNMATEDLNGRIWIISESGALDQFDEQTKTFVRANSNKNLSQTFKGITVDNNGKLWLSSNEGLAAFDPNSGRVKKYDVSDGVQSNSFFHKAVIKAKNGNLYFGGPNGFNMFHPDSLSIPKAPVKLSFTSLYIYDQLQEPDKANSPLKKVLPFTDTLTLSYAQSFFSIGFTTLNLFSPAKTKFAYRLQGLHNNWVNLGAERKVSFTNLDPGNYTLNIRYTNLNDDWQESAKKLVIVILPPWYKTWWFKVALLLVVSGAIVTLFYMRLSRIKSQNKILEAEVAKRTNELTEANLFLTERSEEIKLQNEKLEEYNHEILRQSDKILKQQEQIVEQNHKLEQTVEELKKSNQTKDRFFSILAHDLRNPVAALAGIAESLNFSIGRLTQQEIKGYINDIHKSSQNVYNLLINLLNWSKTQSSTIEHIPGKFKIYNLVQKNASLLEQQLHNKEINLTINVDYNHEVFADYNMIDAIIRNLLTNSIKFTYKKGEINIDSIETNNEITITIADNGVGMSKEQLDNLFKIEKNNLSVGTNGETGTGLGMVITNEFIQANGGSITVVSKEGKGSTFKIHLPKGESPSFVEEPLEIDKSAILNSEIALDDFPIEKLIKIKGRRILVVDDNKELRSYLRLMLSGTFEIFEAENGKEGLKSALEIQPTAIISDMIMPVMNGLEFCKEIKSSPSTSHIPVILLTSQTSEESQLSGYGAGADVYLTKPIKKDLLFQIILNFIQNQELIREKIMNSNNFFPEDISINKVDEEFLQKVIGVIEENLSDPNFDYKEICEQTAMSRTVLYTKMKTITGQGVHEFIKAIRLKKSMKLLMEGRSPSQVSFEVGFNSHSYFNKCFIKQYGKQPKEFVKKKNLRSNS